jgi:hypothetical protein
MHFLRNIIWVIKSKRKCAGHVACTEHMGNSRKILVRNPEKKRPLSTPRRGWEKNTECNI